MNLLTMRVIVLNLVLNSGMILGTTGYDCLFFRLPEKLNSMHGVPTVEVDWKKFYAMRDEDLNRLVHGKRLLTNEEAVQTGLLRCKYLDFLIFLISIPVFVLIG